MPFDPGLAGRSIGLARGRAGRLLLFGRREATRCNGMRMRCVAMRCLCRLVVPDRLLVLCSILLRRQLLPLPLMPVRRPRMPANGLPVRIAVGCSLASRPPTILVSRLSIAVLLGIRTRDPIGLGEGRSLALLLAALGPAVC